MDAVALKLPTFWASQPEVWFAQTEAQFNLCAIVADDTKYYYVIAALGQETAARLVDLIGQPPGVDKAQSHGGDGHHTYIVQPLGIAVTYGAKSLWGLAALQGLQASQ